MAEERKHYRPSWDDYFMAITLLIASRGSCDRLYTGSVLVKNKRIIATGYNGAAPGLDNCNEVGHLLEEGHCVRTIHGEHNALLQAARLNGTSTEDSTLYTKYSPCIHCTKYIIGCGVKRVVIGKIYRNATALEMLEKAGVQVDYYEDNPAWNNEIIKLFSEGIADRRNEGEVNLETKKY